MACRTFRLAERDARPRSSRDEWRGSAPPCVLTGDSARRERRRQPFEVLHGHVEGRDPEAPELDRISEVDTHATSMGAAERHVPVPHAPADADRRDPVPRPLDAPRDDVGHRRVNAEEAEMRIQLLVHDHERIAGPHPEEAEQWARRLPDAKWKLYGCHVRGRVAGSRATNARCMAG